MSNPEVEVSINEGGCWIYYELSAPLGGAKKTAMLTPHQAKKLHIELDNYFNPKNNMEVSLDER